MRKLLLAGILLLGGCDDVKLSDGQPTPTKSVKPCADLTRSGNVIVLNQHRYREQILAVYKQCLRAGNITTTVENPEDERIEACLISAQSMYNAYAFSSTIKESLPEYEGKLYACGALPLKD